MFFQIIDMGANNAYVTYKKLKNLGHQYGFSEFWEVVFQELTSECKEANNYRSPFRVNSVAAEHDCLQNVGLHIPFKTEPKKGLKRIQHRCALCCDKNSGMLCVVETEALYSSQCKKFLCIQKD